MTKIDIVTNISRDLGVDKVDVKIIIEKFMSEIIGSMEQGENVYLRGFGSFVVKKKASKIGRNITKKEPVLIPERHVPTFKPARVFSLGVQSKLKHTL
ncbi:MAG: integration host factor subunit beta [Flavobacteriaceae bacterium]|nr:integration host factor subunit beta [Flavobacteriaceae bacterium]MCY4216915.1 integration host factor subunit beta [Flavobacteriaceae bacterium]MCY4253558.1 integration host factor subunit beta [Flavobacteriaceae bacterium]